MNILNIQKGGIMHDAQVFIWDETLRDGEQTPGVSLSIEHH